MSCQQIFKVTSIYELRLSLFYIWLHLNGFVKLWGMQSLRQVIWGSINPWLLAGRERNWLNIPERLVCNTIGVSRNKLKFTSSSICQGHTQTCLSWLLFLDPNEGEDCLFLDVVVPGGVDQSSERKPVMVWIHGGSYLTGYRQQYIPTPLAVRGDVIVVTINYRLGIFGFLYSGQGKLYRQRISYTLHLLHNECIFRGGTMQPTTWQKQCDCYCRRLRWIYKVEGVS